MQKGEDGKVGEFGETLVAVNSFQSWQRGGSKYLNSVAWNGEKGRKRRRRGGKKEKATELKSLSR